MMLRALGISLIAMLASGTVLAQPLILITNDDGYESPDLRALAMALNDQADVMIVAPQGNRSGSATSLGNLRAEAAWSEFAFDGADVSYWIDATPSVATHWGIVRAEQHYGRQPDLVISGINAGMNDGQSHHYSGTVGAARTARLYGISALAVSLDRAEGRDLEGAAEWVAAFVARLPEDGETLFLNINMPATDLDAHSPSMITQPADLRLEIYDQRMAPLTVETELRSGVARWNYRDVGEAADGSDVAAINAGLISITPLTVEYFDSTQSDRIPQ